MPAAAAVPGGSPQWSPVLWLEPAAPGKGTTRRLLLFYTQSSRAECRRPAAGKMPALWVPGGDIKMTALMETLPPPAGAGPPRAGEDTAAAQLQEWGGADGADTDTGDGGGGRWASRWAPPRTIFAEEAEVRPATYCLPRHSTHLNPRVLSQTTANDVEGQM